MKPRRCIEFVNRIWYIPKHGLGSHFNMIIDVVFLFYLATIKTLLFGKVTHYEEINEGFRILERKAFRCVLAVIALAGSSRGHMTHRGFLNY